MTPSELMGVSNEVEFLALIAALPAERVVFLYRLARVHYPDDTDRFVGRLVRGIHKLHGDLAQANSNTLQVMAAAEKHLTQAQQAVELLKRATGADSGKVS